MNFKEQVEKDFVDVFLNLNEFGRICSWNGHPLLIAEAARLEQEAFATNGLNEERKRIICRRADLEPPRVTEQVNFDGDYWQVEDVRTPLFQVIITLVRRRS